MAPLREAHSRYAGVVSILDRALNIGEAKKFKEYESRVSRITAFEPELEHDTDEELKERMDLLREHAGKGEPIDELLPECFAVVRETGRRLLGMRHFDVQLIGGMALHDGQIAEMKTGEGKTLTATLAVVLNSLAVWGSDHRRSGQRKGVHVVTVNDYLARRDAEWMGPIYNALGVSVGVLQNMQSYEDKHQAYSCDVVYGTNSEFGFDYLRDNMAKDLAEKVQRGHPFAIIDEVDNILIDEARTPLIISGAPEQAADLYATFARLAPTLTQGKTPEGLDPRTRKEFVADFDYEVDEKNKTVSITEQGVGKAERFLGIDHLYRAENGHLVNHLIQALRAESLYKRKVDYEVIDGEVKIIDEFTGRILEGRRWSEGLHQAVEAKEGVRVQEENQTLATITYQNYFRLYEKLSGMTGTALTEATEFMKIYELPVVQIPTNMPMARVDRNDQVYKTKEGKWTAVLREIEARHQIGQPVLVGTISIEKSELLSRLLEKRGVPHQVLNAKHHEREAQIVAQAGQMGTVTIATNMAGRGTDIVLGQGVPAVGGLHILGTERHESRRIDNQLRGRSGRQGDPGSSQFYISLEDDLMRIFGSERMQGLMGRLGMDDEQPIESPMLTRAIENAQRKVESRNFDLRKHVLEYDDVMNLQRHVIYTERRRVLEGEDLREQVAEFLEKSVDNVVGRFCTEGVHPDEWNRAGLVQFAEQIFLDPSQLDPQELEGQSKDMIRTIVLDEANKSYEQREALVGSEVMRQLERMFLLHSMDEKWVMHLDAMDDLREGITLRAYGQRDPLVEYKREAYEMFQDMTDAIQEDAVRMICKVQIVQEAPPPPPPPPIFLPTALLAAGGGEETRTPHHGGKTIGRNDPCPCGSGKKYKHCHGRNAS